MQSPDSAGRTAWRSARNAIRSVREAARLVEAEPSAEEAPALQKIFIDLATFGLVPTAVESARGPLAPLLDMLRRSGGADFSDHADRRASPDFAERSFGDWRSGVRRNDESQGPRVASQAIGSRHVRYDRRLPA
jgi:hypothetical protein